MKYINFVCMFLSVSMMLYADSDRMTKGQFRFEELRRATEAQLSSNGKCSQEFMDQQVKPLLLESIEQGEIWDNTLKVLTVPSFNSFLIPEIGKQPNPFFRYSLAIFLASNRFQNSDLAFRQESCFELVKMLCKEEYAEFHPFVTRMLFQYFHAPEYYGKHAQRWLTETLEKRDLSKDPRIVLLLLFMPPEVYFHWRTQMAHTHPELFGDLDSKNLLSWIALVLAARNNPQEYMEKLTQTLDGIDGSAKGVAKATVWFPYLSLVRTPEMVHLLKEYLKDETIIDQGDDILHRNTGLAVLAAYSLYTMLEGFPAVSRHEFTQADRKKCLDWLEQTETYHFRPLDYWTSDPIITRIRYMIFEKN